MFSSFRPVSYALGLTFLLASCGDNKTAETSSAAPGAMTVADSAAMPTDSLRMAKAGGVVVDGVAMTADKNIVENAAGAKSVSTLVAAVKAADLAEALSGTGPFTVFAPTNAAFDKLPKGALAGLQKPESKAKLQGVLKYHVIPSRLLAADFRDGSQLTTLNGEKLTISVKDGKVMVSNGTDAPVTVQIADVISKNGVTHVVDGVLLPTGK
jgi:uncharacterized surface protein with fasciclin (FAS1) repeats